MAHSGRAHEDAPEESGRAPGAACHASGRVAQKKLSTVTWGSPHGLLFPGLVPGKPISDATLGQALKRMGYGPDRIVPHGFRAMASTQLNEQGHAPDIIELQLAHRDSSVSAISTIARPACPSGAR